MTRSLHFLATALLLGSSFCAAQEKVYTPKGGARPSTGKVSITRVRLVEPQEIFDRNTSAQKLAALVKDVEKNVTKAIPADAPAFELLVTATISSGEKPKFELASRGEASEQILQSIHDALHKVADTRSAKESLRVEVHFVVGAKP